MSDVSVVGLGATGSALARALLRGGHRVTVWNRTRAKADPLVRDGAMLAELAPVVAGEVRLLGERIQTNRYDESQAALKTYSAAAVRLVQQAGDSRIAPDFPRYAAATFEQGMSAGLGNEDLAALIKVLRRSAQLRPEATAAPRAGFDRRIPRVRPQLSTIAIPGCARNLWNDPSKGCALSHPVRGNGERESEPES